MKTIMRSAIYLIVATLLYSTTYASNRLTFTNGKFKILQLTDIHWAEGKPSCVQSKEDICILIKKEQPHIVILTGDIVDSKGKNGWQSIASIFDSLSQPFTLILGNHDPEVNRSDSIYRWISTSKYFVGYDKNIKKFDQANFVIPIYNHKQVSTPIRLLYCLDSHSSRQDNRYGEYEWISPQQIRWVEQVSKEYKTKDKVAIPSLSFIHIPLPEYKLIIESNKYFGNYLEGGIASPVINSGYFSSLVEMGNAMGVFCGHDHDNDFIGQHYGIALAYGRVSGREAYGKMERGGRVIELSEEATAFSSWITTPTKTYPKYYYPSGITSEEEQNLNYLPSLNLLQQSQRGLRYNYYIGKSGKVALIESLDIKDKGVTPDFNIKHHSEKDYFAYKFYGYIHIPKRGVYNLSTYSDDGSKLIIDGQTIVDNDGGHSARHAYGKVALESGFHQIELLYFENYMGEELKVYIEGVDLPYQEVPSTWLYH